MSFATRERLVLPRNGNRLNQRVQSPEESIERTIVANPREGVANLREGGLRRDLVDSDAGVHLAMSGTSPRILPLAKLLDGQLVAERHAQNLC